MDDILSAYHGLGTTVDSTNITALLTDWSCGDRAALDRVIPLVYGELRQIARRQLRRERGDHTLQATGLVHEAFARLVDQRRVQWDDREHFFRVAAHLMRRILVDYARRHHAAKRGGGTDVLSLTEAARAGTIEPFPILPLDEALDRLAKVDPDQARIVELRVFGGLTIEETAHAIGVSGSTVTREWRTARAWLYRELYGVAR